MLAIALLGAASLPWIEHALPPQTRGQDVGDTNNAGSAISHGLTVLPSRGGD